ncbi:MAG: ribose 5-phosphate isomerase B [Dehalococcoidia bacterium]|nr:ribose 5-phosphate isomerase B [Dehalococcoidia bacterium]
MRIAFGCDHRALGLKKGLVGYATAFGHECADLGCYGEAPVDYPDIAREVGKAVAAGQYDKGVLICGTGIGMSMAANRLKEVRAALCHNVFTAGRARQHNDANVLCLGAEVVDAKTAEQVLLMFLNTNFEGGRHARRLEIMKRLEWRDLP